MDCEISAVLTNANQTLPLAKLGENKFRIDSKSWFLTYPKCPVGKTLAMELLKSKRPVKRVWLWLRRSTRMGPPIYTHSFC